MIQTSRRSFITGLVSFVAAPAIVKAESLMPVKSVPHLITIRTALPQATWRKINEGIPYGRSPVMDLIDWGKIEELLRKAPPQPDFGLLLRGAEQGR